MNFPQEKPEDNTASLQAFYSKHILGPDGRPTAKWQTDNLTRITTPFPLTLSFDLSKQVTKILCHKKVADSLLRVYERILAHYGSLEEVKKARMHLFAGCFNFRLVGGSSRLSTHAFGAGIDIDSEKNPRGKKHDPNPAKKMMPLEVVKIFKEEGWRWGGDFKKIPDAMHFQATK
jgi:D-alanyl-D-alanine carboxypeptidase